MAAVRMWSTGAVVAISIMAGATIFPSTSSAPNATVIVADGAIVSCNGVETNTEGGPVTVTRFNDGAAVAFAVHFSGPGMTEPKLDGVTPGVGFAYMCGLTSPEPLAVLEVIAIDCGAPLPDLGRLLVHAQTAITGMDIVFDNLWLGTGWLAACILHFDPPTGTPLPVAANSQGPVVGCFGTVLVSLSAGGTHTLPGLDADAGPCNQSNPPCNLYTDPTVFAGCQANPLACCTPLTTPDQNAVALGCIRDTVMRVDINRDGIDENSQPAKNLYHGTDCT